MRRFLLALVLLCAFAAPAWAIDPDGTWLTCPGVTVIGVDGTWTCPGSADPTTGQYVLYLNGVAKSNGMWDANGNGQGYDLRLGGGGHLFTQGTQNHYPGYVYKWTGSSFVIATPQDMLVFTVHSQVHNAPGWIHGHTYTIGQRVNNGAGWNEGTGKFVSYSALKAYEATDASCVSAGAGGPTGTVTIAPYETDGTCHWKYKGNTDYVTLTGWGEDAPAWTADFYGYREVVAAPDASGILTMYENQTDTGCSGPGDRPPITPRACGYSVPTACNSTIAPPNNPGSDGCTWIARAPITYSSGSSHVPKQRMIALNWMYQVVDRPYQADLWNDREYIMGANGETSSYFILTENFTTDNHSVKGVANVACGLGFGSADTPFVPGTTLCPQIISAAPGESFVDTLAANTSLPLRRDPAYGVSIVGQVNAANFFINYNRLQMYNPDGPVITGAGRDADNSMIENMIIEVGRPAAGIGAPWQMGDGINVANSLIISHGPGAIGYMSIYSSHLTHSTVVNPEGNGDLCVFDRWNWVWTQGQTIADTICAGFAHTNGGVPDDNLNFLYYNAEPTKAGVAPHAYTTSPYENGTVSPFIIQVPLTVQWGGPTLKEYPVTGMSYGVSPSNLFMGLNDYRISPTGPLRGAGANYGSINLSPEQFDTPAILYNGDATDILGTARPATGQDIGAWQSGGVAPITYTVTVTSPSNGTVTSSPAGIFCPGTCVHTFSNVTSVTLTEVPSPNFVFSGWGGNCSGTNITCPLTTTNQTVTASFAANNPPPSSTANRVSRLNVHPARNPSPVTGLLEMPSGISGQQTVDVGAGSQDIAIYMGSTFGNPRPIFYVVASDGVTDVQVTSSTTNPMRVTYDDPHDGNFRAQAFVFHGDWGITISQIKIHEVTTDSLFGAQFGNPANGYEWPAVTVDALGRGLQPPPPSTSQGTPYGQPYYYFGPRLGDSFSLTSKGLTNGISGLGHPEVVFEPCNLNVPYVVCPPNFTDSESVIIGVKKDGVTQIPGTLSSFISADLSVAHTFELPAGTFVGTGAVNVGHTIRGQGMGVTILDDHGISAFGGKGIIDLESGGATIADITLKNALGAKNASGVFNTAGFTFDHVEITQTQVGVHGGSYPSTVLINNSNIHDNGNDDFLQHELYINGGGPCMFNNDQVIAGERPDHALKSRCAINVVNGGQIAGCLDPYEEVCGSVIDFASGLMADVQGMYSETVAGTIHTGDVLTLTFHSVVNAAQSDIVVTSAVAAGPPTAAAAATSLLTALQANSSLSANGFYFSAGGTAKSTDTSDTINVFGPGFPTGPMRSWTITPTVTGSSHTTTLTQSLTPVELVLPANVIVQNGSSIIIQYGAESPNPARLNLDNVHITNLSPTYFPVIKSFGGGELTLHNCKYAGIDPGIEAVGLDKGWDRIFGTCVSDSINVNPATISADGTTSLAGGGADLITESGTWHWGTATSGGNFKLMLEGADSGINAGASWATMRVDHNGTMFAKAVGGTWYTYHGGYWEWHTDVDPTLITADATTANSPSGTVNTWEGTWTFGAASGSDRLILLNGGAPPCCAGAAGVQFKVANGGRLYVKNNANVWFIWDGQFQAATPP